MTRPARRWWSRLDPRVTDAGVAALLLGLTLLSYPGVLHEGQRPADDALAWLLAIGLCAPFAVHRKAPWAALAVTLVVLLVFASLRYAPYPGIPVFVLLFGLTLHGSRRASLVAFAATATALTVALILQPPSVAQANDWIATFLATAVAWLAADNIRQRRARWTAMEERTRLLERERDERDRAAAMAERLRIARELHDVVAHSISLIAVQAGVGHHVIDTDPAGARTSLGVIEQTSRDALVEMRRMLGALRDGSEPAAVTPSPGLADLNTLAAEVRRTGLGVTLEVTGDGGEVPAGVDLAAYRVVQEALTNVVKHGGPVAHVRVEQASDGVTIEVADKGRPEAAASGPGHGLAGMRERVALYGGTLETGPRPGGGFRVRAVLPYAAAPR